MQCVEEWNVFMSDTSFGLDQFDCPVVCQVKVTMVQYSYLKDIMKCWCMFHRQTEVGLLVVESESLSILKMVLESDELMSHASLEEFQLLFDRHINEVNFDSFTFMWWMSLKMETELNSPEFIENKHLVLKLMRSQISETSKHSLIMEMEENSKNTEVK